MNSSDESVQIPGFEILGVAGRGGMGIVYRARQDSPRRIVALKVLHRARMTPEALEELRREAELAAGLEHPAIVPLYSFGEHEGLPYLVFRFMPGGTASDRLKAGGVDFATAVDWVRRVAEALSFAHERGVIHRDVKPSNFLLDEQGNAYLTDFGIAGALGSERSQDATGSAPYMAPEQALGKEAGQAADIYSLAVSLFELLTGEPPYVAETALGLRARHLHDPIPSARDRNQVIPPAVDELVAWTMAKEARLRPSSVRHFANSLDRALRQPDRPLRPPPTRKGERPRKRIWLAMAALGVIGGLILVLGLGAIGYLALRPTPQNTATATRPASAPMIDASPSPQGFLFQMDFEGPATEPDATPDPDGGVRVVDGSLQFEILRQGVEWFYPSNRVQQQDAVQIVRVQFIDGASVNEIGFLCRWLDPNNYVALAMSSGGEASIWKLGAGEVARLAGWSRGPVLEPGGTMEARCVGSSLQLYWQERLVLEAEDPAPQTGDVGLLVGLRDEGSLDVRLDGWRAELP